MLPHALPCILLKSTFHHCKQCSGAGFDTCEACHSRGVECEIFGHQYEKRFAATDIVIEASADDIRSYVQWRIDHVQQ